MVRIANDTGFYELNPFPGCNQIIVSNHSVIYKRLRGQGIGTTAHEQRLKHIEHLGYDVAICTCREDNIPQIKILNKFGWKKVHSFKNYETDNEIGIWIKQIS